MGPAELQLYKMSRFSHTEESGVGWSEEELTGGRKISPCNQYLLNPYFTPDLGVEGRGKA